MQLQKKNRPALEWAMKKFLVIESNPEAGAPLGGVLSGFRKLTISNRDWRVVWRVTSEDSGATIIDIGEIWAVGARRDSELYEGMRRRLDSLPWNEQIKTLTEVVDLLAAKRKRKKTVGHPLDEPDHTPAEVWQIADLVNIAGYPEELARQLTKAEATKAWEMFRSHEL
ncbi:MAG: hypothetical protein JWM55_1269 [Acidimicrobiaceae bacterium]|nr:hypothetical protein [Acidimicrobiaceae bacterium]